MCIYIYVIYIYYYISMYVWFPCTSFVQERKLYVDLPKDIYGVAIAVSVGDLPLILGFDSATKARTRTQTKERQTETSFFEKTKLESLSNGVDRHVFPT